MALQYIGGTPIEEIPAVVVEADYVSINTAAAEALKIEPIGDTLQVGETDYDVNYLG